MCEMKKIPNVGALRASYAIVTGVKKVMMIGDDSHSALILFRSLISPLESSDTFSIVNHAFPPRISDSLTTIRNREVNVTS